MGSTAVLLRPQPTCVRCPSPTLKQHRPPILTHGVAQSVLPRLSRRRSRRLVCCAASDDGEKKLQEKKQSLGGVGSVVEERPPGASLLKGALDTFQEEESSNVGQNKESSLYNFLYPSQEELPDDVEMSIWDHLEELRQRVFVSVLGVGAAILGCFAFSKDLILLLEAPVSSQGVKFLQLSPGEFFFTTLKVSGYSGLLLGSPLILYEIIAFVVPGLTREERKFLGPIVLGSSILFYTGVFFSYSVLTPAALNFFVNYAEGAVESFWSIDQYFEFTLVLMFSTGLAFQVPVIQLLLGQAGLITGDQMLSVWRYVVVGAVVAAAVLTPSTDPLTQILLAGPLMALYLGGAWMVAGYKNTGQTNTCCIATWLTVRFSSLCRKKEPIDATSQMHRGLEVRVRGSPKPDCDVAALISSASPLSENKMCINQQS